MAKIAVTMCDYGVAMHLGGDIDRETIIVEVNDARLDEWLTYYRKPDNYFSIGLSLVKEAEDGQKAG